MFINTQFEKNTMTSLSDPKNMPRDISRPNRFAVRSTKVILEEYEDPIEAIIFVEEEKIAEVCVVSQVSKETIEKMCQDWEVRDYGDLYIFPGVVDSNVHLHTNFGSEWENITYATELAASGGVTTIIDNPIMSKPFSTSEEYFKSIQQRIKLIRTSSKVDYGVYGLLESRTEECIDKMIELGVMGFKCYLMNCFQSTINHYPPERLQSLLKSIEEKYPETLLAIHPEMATERELYQSSPCRTFTIEKRLDMGHKIQSLEFGGGAHKGSYIDDFARKDDSEDGEEDGDSAAGVDTPTKLRDRINKTREKSEIEDLVYFEKASYYFEEKNGDSDEENCNEDFITAGSPEKPKAIKNEFPEESKEAMSPNCFKPERKTAPAPVLIREPLFAVSSVEEIEDSETPKVEGKSGPPISKESTGDTCKNTAQQIDLFGQNKLASAQPVHYLRPNNYDSSFNEKDKRSTFDMSEENCPKSGKKEFAEDQTNQPVFNRSSRKLSSLRTFSDGQLSLSPVRSEFSNNFGSKDLDDDNDEDMPRKKPQLKMNLSLIEKTSMTLDSSPRLKSTKSLNVSPIFRGSAPTSSNLLARRISGKSSFGMQVSTSSNLSSPVSDLTKINLLNTSKVSVKNEEKYNQSYRIFLANRPLSWEENAVSTIISCMNSESKIRVMLQNLSLGTSFLKISDKKKAHMDLTEKIISDCSPSYLYFTDKMVKKGEAKYKVSPPFRSKDNRHDLIENLKLGGIDIVSSYHFYVPPRFKMVDDGNFRRAFSGLDSIGCSLQATWTAMYCSESEKEKTIGKIMAKLSKVMCLNPAKALRIDSRKGSLAKKKDADFVIWDPFQIKEICLNPNHVFSGKSLYGAIHKTYLRGHLIYCHEDSDQMSRTFTSEFIKPKK